MPLCMCVGRQDLHTSLRTHIKMHTYIYTYIHTYMHIHTCMHADTHRHTHIHITHIHAHTYILTDMHANTRTCILSCTIPSVYGHPPTSSLKAPYEPKHVPKRSQAMVNQEQGHNLMSTQPNGPKYHYGTYLDPQNTL